MPIEARKPYLYHFRIYFYNTYYFIKPHCHVNSEKFAARTEKGQLVRYINLHRKIY